MAKKRRKPVAPKESPAQAAPAIGAPSRRAFWLVVAAGLLPASAAFVHFPGVNGPWYWRWVYVATDPTLFFAVAAAVGVAVCWAAGERSRRRRAVAALMLLHLTLTLSFAALSSKGLHLIGERVADADITSYHTEALRTESVSELLDDYDRRLHGMIGHAKTHPPGPILYYVFWNRLLGPQAGAQWGGLFLVALASLIVPFVYLLTRRLAGPDAGLSAAAVAVGFPGIIVMPGAFDSVYPVLTAALALTWSHALEGSRRAALLCGAALFVGFFFTPAFLVLGAFFALYASLGLAWNPAASRRALIESVAVGSVVVVGLFALAAAVFGYDHPASLQSAMAIQERIARGYNRPWSSTVVWDVYDFFLASGWSMAAVLALFLTSWRKRGFDDAAGRLRAFAFAGLSTIVIVDLTGLLRAETARVWLFLQPFVIVLVGCELARWTPGRRQGYFAVLLFALVVLRTRMLF